MTFDVFDVAADRAAYPAPRGGTGDPDGQRHDNRTDLDRLPAAVVEVR